MSRQALRDFYKLQAQKSKEDQRLQELPEADEEHDTQEQHKEPDQEPQPGEDEDQLPEIDPEADLLSIVSARQKLLQQKRQLESEQKALIYNNYKKLIKASAKLESIHSNSEIPDLTTTLNEIAKACNTERRTIESPNFAALAQEYEQKWGHFA